MTKMRDLKQETYLGDGLYASFDERGIRLRGGADELWLTLGKTLPALLAYVDDLKVKLSQHLKNEAKD